MPSFGAFALVVCASAPGLAIAQAPVGLADGIQLLQVAAAGLDILDSGTFSDDADVICIQGSARVAEAALATFKASPLGGLYYQTFAERGLMCSFRNYTFGGEEDACFPGTQVFYRSEAEQKRFKAMQTEALQAFQQAYSIDSGMAQALAACSCHPSSKIGTSMKHICEDINGDAIGSWVRKNPQSHKALFCYEGPYQYTVRALATMKSSMMLQIDRSDKVAPVSCASQGFLWMSESEDPCWPGLQTWTRTESPMSDCPPGGMGQNNPHCEDPGILENRVVEAAVGGAFKDLAAAFTLSPVLISVPECNCVPGSAVNRSNEASLPGVACRRESDRSPVRDFWTG